jgi:hypothetical protein
LVASNTSEKSPRTATRTASEQRVIGRPFKRGQSGNLLGRGAREVRKAELYAAILKDTGGPLSALEDAFAHEAARQLARASTSKDDALRVRLVNASAKLVDRIKASIAARSTGPKVSAFDQYVAKLGSKP